MGTKKDIYYFMKWCEFFKIFSDEEMDILTNYFGWMEFKKDEVIYKEGVLGIGMGIIIQGVAEVIIKEHCKEKVIAILRKGEIIGELSLLDDNPRSADVIAKSETSAIVISRSNFERLIQEEIEIAIKFVLQIARLLAQRIRKENIRLAEIKMI